MTLQRSERADIGADKAFQFTLSANVRAGRSELMSRQAVTQDARDRGPRRASSSCSRLGGWFGLVVVAAVEVRSTLDRRSRTTQVEPRRPRVARSEGRREARRDGQGEGQGEGRAGEPDRAAAGRVPGSRQDAVDPAPGARSSRRVSNVSLESFAPSMPTSLSGYDAIPIDAHRDRPLPRDPALRARAPRAGRLRATATSTPPGGCSRSRRSGSRPRPTGCPS